MIGLVDTHPQANVPKLDFSILILQRFILLLLTITTILEIMIISTNGFPPHFILAQFNFFSCWIVFFFYFHAVFLNLFHPLQENFRRGHFLAALAGAGFLFWANLIYFIGKKDKSQENETEREIWDRYKVLVGLYLLVGYLISREMTLVDTAWSQFEKEKMNRSLLPTTRPYNADTDSDHDSNDDNDHSDREAAIMVVEGTRITGLEQALQVIQSQQAQIQTLINTNETLVRTRESQDPSLIATTL